MKILIKAKPGAREESIQQIDEDHYIVSVKEPPIQGRANSAIIKVLAQHFNLSQSAIKIVSGYASRNKIIEIPDPKLVS